MSGGPPKKCRGSGNTSWFTWLVRAENGVGRGTLVLPPPNDLDRQLIIQVKEAEMLGNRVSDLEGRLATQGKLLAERDFENNQLRQASQAAERTVKELRDEINQTNGGRWNWLGTFSLEVGNEKVVLSCWTGSGYVVVADAIKWVKQ